MKSTGTPLMSMWWKTPTEWENSEMCKMKHIFTTCFFKPQSSIWNPLTGMRAAFIEATLSKFHWGWPDSEIDWFSQLFIHENRNTTSLMPTMGALILNEVRIEPISTHNSPAIEKEKCVSKCNIWLRAFEILEACDRTIACFLDLLKEFPVCFFNSL